MRLPIALSATALCLPLLGAWGQSAPRVPPDSARLQGTWTMVSGSADGSALPASMLPTMSRTLTGSHLVVTMNSQTYLDAIVTLYPDSTPRAIDYQMKAGVPAGSLELGIYRWAGDTIEFCIGAPGQSRPITFTDVAGNHRTHSRWIHSSK